jgi:hypothetical protein
MSSLLGCVLRRGLYQYSSFCGELFGRAGQVAKKEVKVKAPCTEQKAWIPPPEGAIKVNTDAAVARNNG